MKSFLYYIFMVIVASIAYPFQVAAALGRAAGGKGWRSPKFGSFFNVQ